MATTWSHSEGGTTTWGLTTGDTPGNITAIDATFTGDVSVGDDITITDLLSVKDINASGSATIDGSLTAGGGYVAGTGSGVTLTSAGAVSMNNTLTVASNAIIDSLTVGGGYPSTGVTISNTGNLQVAGLLTVDGNIKTGGHITALSVQPEGADKPKLDLEENDNIRLKLTVSSVEKNIMKVSSTGEMKLTNTSGIQKFLVKGDGSVKFTGMTTVARDAIDTAGEGEAGDIVYDTDTKNFYFNDGIYP